jgi:AraC-like DNA-binding protein
MYTEQAPPSALSRWVECSWSIESTRPLRGYAVMPDGCLDLIYSPESGLRAIGAMTVTRHHNLCAGVPSAGVRFQPGMARRFFRIAPSELTDQAIALDDLPGRSARELERRLGEAKSSSEIVKLLVGQVFGVDAAVDPVQKAIEAITAAHGDIDLNYVSSKANLSPRQFRRRCLEESGLSPRRLCRILRFRYASQLASRAPRDWAGIAQAAGYYDQAHLIRDFREFSGVTPMSVFSNTAWSLTP